MLDVLWLTDYETGKSFRIGLVFATDECRYEQDGRMYNTGYYGGKRN